MKGTPALTCAFLCVRAQLENMMLDTDGNVKIGDFGFSNIFRADSLMVRIRCDAFKCAVLLLSQ